MISFENVSVCYQSGKDALSNISFNIDHKQMTFLTGHSGAGKSTLLRTILKMVEPVKGRVVVDGVDLSKLTRRDLPEFRLRIGSVFQDPHLLPNRTVFENVAIPLRIMGMSENKIRNNVQTALGRVGLHNFQWRMPPTLSAGEHQRVGIARALVHRPRLLLADEPTGNLDPDLSREILKLFSHFNSHDTTILIATHDVSLLSTYNHQVFRLDQGQLQSAATL